MTKIIRIKEVTSRSGLSKSYIYALEKANKFPKKIRLIKDGAAVGWLESEIQEWISSRIQERDKGVE
jgi:prophage regulatory protein